MNLSDIAALSSTVSGLAVLVSLVYLNIQTKHAQRHQQALIRSIRATRLVEMNLTAAQPALAEAWAKGMAGTAEMTGMELTQFMYACRATFTNSEDAFYQHKEGLLNDAAFSSFVATVKYSFGSRGYRTAWQRSRDLYGEEFIRFMDQALAEVPIRPPTDRLAQWRADLAADEAREAAVHQRA
jgi:hypothetical protein